MKKVGIVIFAVALMVGVVASNIFSFGNWGGTWHLPFHFGAVEGSGRAASDVRDVAAFHGIDVGGVFKVQVTAGDSTRVEVRADDNLLPLIRTRVDRNGILHIGSDRRIRSSSDILIRVTTPDIDTLDVSGAANVTVAGIKNEELNIEASGVSRIKASGETTRLSVDISGATKVDVEDLAAVDADVEASGASSALVNVTGRLDADLSGASDVTYSGSPSRVEKKTSGASHVTAK